MEGGKAYRRGLWTEEEDRILMDHIMVHGKGKWNQVARMTGLKRCGKSCRLRWINYLSPNVKRDDFSEQEEDLIIRLHKLLGNRWSLIAGRVPGRTDNQVKNHWNTHLSKKLGVKKGKFKVCGSPKTCLSEVEKNLKVAPKLNSEEPLDGKCGAGGQEVDGDGPKGTIGFCGTEEWSLSGINENESSFGLSNDDFNPSTLGLMEFIDSCSLDFVWHGL